MFVYTHTQSFCDFHRLLGDLSPPAVCFQVLIPDQNRGRENTKYYIPGNIGCCAILVLANHDENIVLGLLY